MNQMHARASAKSSLIFYFGHVWDCILAARINKNFKCSGNSYFITSCCKLLRWAYSYVFKRPTFLQGRIPSPMHQLQVCSCVRFCHLGPYCHIFSRDVLDLIGIGLETHVFLPYHWHTCTLQHSFILTCKWVSVTCLIFFLGAIQHPSIFVSMCLLMHHILIHLMYEDVLKKFYRFNVTSRLLDVQNLGMEFKYLELHAD